MHKQTWDEDCPVEWVELPEEIWIGDQSVCYSGKLDGQPFYHHRTGETSASPHVGIWAPRSGGIYGGKTCLEPRR